MKDIKKLDTKIVPRLDRTVKSFTRIRTVNRSDPQSHISRQLKAIYDEVLGQPVPDRLVALLKELDAKRDDL